MSTTIRELIRGNIPETYSVLTAEATATMDGQERPDVVGNSVKTAMSFFFPAGEKVEGDLTQFQAQYVADYATRLVIPAGIDYYSVRTGRSDSFSRPPGVTPLGGESRQNYDRIQALKDVDTMLKDRLAANEAAFKTSVSSGSRVGMTIDSTPEQMLSLEARTAMPRPDNAPAERLL